MAKLVLADLYSSAEGRFWKTNTNWASDKPLEMWHGVTVNFVGDIIKLKIVFNRLKGMHNTYWHGKAYLGFSGDIHDIHHLRIGPMPSSLGDLSVLEHLELQGNQLTGILPFTTFTAYDLVILSPPRLTWEIFKPFIIGPIPPTISKLEALKCLFLQKNKLSGIKPHFMQSLARQRLISLW